MTETAYQLYSSREFPPLEKTLTMLAELGYTRTEGYRGLFADPEATKAALDVSGLTMPSAHVALDDLINDRDGIIRIAEMLGISSIYAPSLPAEERPADTAGWTAFGQKLEAVGETYRAAGFHFGWHNHAFEFQPTPDGSVPMRLILEAAPNIGWEADIAWIVRGGADSFEWIGEYGGRITAVHIKDIAAEGECLDEDGWADVGHGTLNWRRLFRALQGSPLTLRVMEHDKPNDDRRFARRSMETVKSICRSA